MTFSINLFLSPQIFINFPSSVVQYTLGEVDKINGTSNSENNLILGPLKYITLHGNIRDFADVKKLEIFEIVRLSQTT